MSYQIQQGQSVRVNTMPAPPPLSTGNVAESLSVTDRLISQLHEEILTLEQRLSPVLRSAPPTGNTNGIEPARSEPCQLAIGIENLNARIVGISSAVNSILSRVDL